MAKSFVKAADTQVSVKKSQQDIIGTLRRYNARDFGFDEDPDTNVATVRFRVRGTAGDFPVALVVHVDKVHAALYAGKEAWKSARGGLTADDVRRKWREQSKRTAWRLLVDWLDAALSTTTLGVQSVEEVFLAHAVLPTADGRQGRVIDYITTAMVAGGALPSLPLLSAPKD